MDNTNSNIHNIQVDEQTYQACGLSQRTHGLVVFRVLEGIEGNCGEDSVFEVTGTAVHFGPVKEYYVTLQEIINCKNVISDAGGLDTTITIRSFDSSTGMYSIEQPDKERGAQFTMHSEQQRSAKQAVLSFMHKMANDMDISPTLLFGESYNQVADDLDQDQRARDKLVSQMEESLKLLTPFDSAHMFSKEELHDHPLVEHTEKHSESIHDNDIFIEGICLDPIDFSSLSDADKSARLLPNIKVEVQLAGDSNGTLTPSWEDIVWQWKELDSEEYNTKPECDCGQTGMGGSPKTAPHSGWCSVVDQETGELL